MELKKRSEFPENELWDLTALYQDQEDFLRAIEKTREEINEFVRNYKGKLHTFEDFEVAFAIFEQIQIQLSHIGNYSFMPQTTDFGDEAFAEIAQAGMDFETWASVELSFFDDAFLELFPSVTSLWAVEGCVRGRRLGPHATKVSKVIAAKLTL